MTRRMLAAGLVFTSIAGCLVTACGGDSSPAALTKSTPPKKPPPPPPPPPPPSPSELPDSVKSVVFAESDFVESERSRDPFRSFAASFGERETRTAENQRRVILNKYALEDLKLVAILRGEESPRAMMIDPTGKGWVLHPGDYLARAETVRTSGSSGTEYQVNWRVDRVRDGDIVLIREDPAQTGAPPATRVIPLHPEGDKNNLQLD